MKLPTLETSREVRSLRIRIIFL